MDYESSWTWAKPILGEGGQKCTAFKQPLWQNIEDGMIALFFNKKINTCLNIVLFKDLPCLCAAFAKTSICHKLLWELQPPHPSIFCCDFFFLFTKFKLKKNLLSLLFGRVFPFTSWPFLEHPLLCFGGAIGCIFFSLSPPNCRCPMFSTPSPIYSTYVSTSNGSNFLHAIGDNLETH